MCYRHIRINSYWRCCYGLPAQGGWPGCQGGGPGAQGGLPGTQGGRKGLRTGGLCGTHIGGRIFGLRKITVPELLSVTGMIVLSVKGLKRPLGLNMALLPVLSKGAWAAVPRPTTIAKANTSNNILDLRLNLLFLFLNHTFFISPPRLMLATTKQPSICLYCLKLSGSYL